MSEGIARTWAGTTDPFWRLRHLPAPDDRKYRLFACAVAREVAHLAKAPGFPEIIALAERPADSEVPAEEVAAACRAEHERYLARDRADQGQSSLLYARYCLLRPVTLDAAVETCGCATGAEAERRRLAAREENESPQDAFDDGWDEMGGTALALQDDIFGDPFAPAAVDPSWLARNGGAVAALAAQIYAERDFALMPVLADALAEAGCTDERTLKHCRVNGHVRGCWVVDLLSRDRIMPPNRTQGER